MNKLIIDAVKDNIFFVVRSHAAPGYSKPTFSSSKITEVVFGEFVKVLSKKGSWLKVLQNDGYKSWIKNFYGSFENEDKYSLAFLAVFAPSV